jgi:hypothetical protein
MSAEEQALRRLAEAARVVGDVLFAGERDPSRREAVELELGCLAVAKACRELGGDTKPARATSIIEVIRSALAAVDNLIPDEQDRVVAALVADLRSRRPVAVAPLDAGFVPTEPVPTRAP